MLSIKGTYDPKVGPIIDLGFARHDFLSAKRNRQDFVFAKALLDTGAARTSTTREIAAKANLQLAGRTPLSSAIGRKPVDVNVYHADIVLLSRRTGSQALDGIITPTKGIVELLPDSPDFQAIAGRDLLCQCDFAMNRDGSFSLIWFPPD